jgi:hypothetical protein
MQPTTRAITREQTNEHAAFDEEYQYLLKCLETDLFPDRKPSFTTQGLDWRKLLELLRQHNLSGHMYVGRKKYLDIWPEWFKEELRQDHYRFLLYGDYCIAQVSKALDEITSRGIEVIVLKGWSLIPSLYNGDYSQRFCHDIDILVRPKDVDDSQTILEQSGWRADVELHPGHVKRFNNARIFRIEQSPGIFGLVFGIGLHWGLFHHPAYNPDQVDIDALFTRKKTLIVAGYQVSELSVEDQVLYGCAHLQLHHRNNRALNRIYEIAAVITQPTSTVNWEVIVERAARWKISVPVLTIFKMINESWSGIIPQAVIEDLEKQRLPLSEKVAQTWIRQIRHSDGSDLLLSWLLMSGIKRRIGFIRDYLFPSKTYMQWYFGPAPCGFWHILYLKRMNHKISRMLEKRERGKTDV